MSCEVIILENNIELTLFKKKIFSLKIIMIVTKSKPFI